MKLVYDPKTAAERNTHEVPAETVLRMQARFENYPGEVIIHTD